MTIESSELFELCKQVYKATGWDKTKDAFRLYIDGIPVPLYTSDYLLEKLPKSVPSKVIEGDSATIWMNIADFKYVSPVWAGYITNKDDKADYGVNSHDLLSALLKLTLKLHEEGLL